MKKSNQTRKTRVTSQNRVAAGKSRKHNQKREGFSGIKEIFTPRRGKKLKTNRYMLQTSVIVVALFLGLAGYVVRFTLKDSVKVSESSYNKRNSSLSEQTKRGKIISANDKILAFQRTMKREMRFGIILMKICLRILLDIPVMEKRVLKRSVIKSC